MSTRAGVLKTTSVSLPLVVILLSLSACGRQNEASVAPRQTAPPPSVSSTPSPDPSRDPPPAPVPSHSPSARPREGAVLRGRYPLGLGSAGEAVAVLQRRLAGLTYQPGPIDGRYGTMTQQAVFAFEKTEGLPRDGTVDRPQMRALLNADPPRAPARVVEHFVDVDLTRQILLEVAGGVVTHTLPISTGNGQPYESTTGYAIARTPRGAFEIHTKVEGWKISYLGGMYYPSYFYDGYAIHGSASVPPYPASHGCVRIPMSDAVGFFERNPIGTPVFVHD